jgi:hypothetical protein
MAVDQNPQSRRPHYQRGRRGPDRRGSERRSTQSPESSSRSADQVDVEQIMRDIRARIAQRHGVELSTQQIQELAARRLEAVLDPRTVNPSLMQQLRRGASSAPDAPSAAIDSGFDFEASTLYESHRGLLRFIRKLLNPILKLLFNPNPIVHALHTQARLNREAAAREAERERTQTEWNALHYEIIQRLVTEVSRVSVEVQSLTLQIDALAGRVDYNDRKVRALDTTTPQPTPRPPARNIEPPVAPTPPAAPEPASPEAASADASQAEGTRRRRRRRRGRRGGAAAAETGAATVVVGGSEGLAGPDSADLINGDESEGEDDDGESSPAPDTGAAATLPDAGSWQRSAAQPASSPEAGFEPTPHRPLPEPPPSHPHPAVPDRALTTEAEVQPVAESILLGGHQQDVVPERSSETGRVDTQDAVSDGNSAATSPSPTSTVSASVPPPPEHVAVPSDEPSPRPPEPTPGPPDR